VLKSKSTKKSKKTQRYGNGQFLLMCHDCLFFKIDVKDVEFLIGFGITKYTVVKSQG